MMRLLRAMLGWTEERSGAVGFVAPIMMHRVPRDAKWWYVFGSATLMFFTIQLVSGVLLATLYAPSAADAFESLRYIDTQVPMGWMLRAIHGWSSNAMVIMVVVHMSQVFLHASFKYPRELTWMVGVLLLFCTLALAFTGQIMRWDQDAYWGLGIGASIVDRVPMMGNQLRGILLGKGDSTTAGNVDIDVYVCDDTTECMNPVRNTVSVKPFTQLVSERLRRMSESAAPNVRHRSRRMLGRDPHESNRVSSPLELLFDLTFAVAFGAAASELAHALELAGAAGEHDAGGEHLLRCATAHLGGDHLEQLLGAGLEHLRDHAAAHDLRALRAERVDLDLFVVDHRGDGVPVAALRELGGGLRHAQRDDQVARHVLAADWQHGGVYDGALREDRDVGGAAADVHQHDALLELLRVEDGLGRCERLEHKGLDADARALDALHEVVHRGGAGGDHVRFDIKA